MKDPPAALLRRGSGSTTRHCPSGMRLPTLEVTAPETGEILSNLAFNTYSSQGLPSDDSTHEPRFGCSIVQWGV